MKYVTVLAYNGPGASKIHLDCIGLFGEEYAAKEAIDDYIANTLEVERGGLSKLSRKNNPC